MLPPLEPDEESMSAEERLAAARALLQRLYGAGEHHGFPDVEPDRCNVQTRWHHGLCDECGARAQARYRLGQAVLCGRCLQRRRSVGDFLAKEWAA